MVTLATISTNHSTKRKTNFRTEQAPNRNNPKRVSEQPLIALKPHKSSAQITSLPKIKLPWTQEPTIISNKLTLQRKQDTLLQEGGTSLSPETIDSPVAVGKSTTSQNSLEMKGEC